ncbi:MAG: hypothetical protein ABIN97_19590 [Ginsengibacter sp.]
MSLLKYIMSPFVEFKDKGEQSLPKEDSSAESKERPVSKGNADSSHTANADSYTGSFSNVSSKDAEVTSLLPQYQKHFEDLLDEANAKNPLFQGTDFKEFIDSKTDVEAITDEGIKYKTAFNVLKRTGLTKDRLITTAKEYMAIVERDLKGFEDAFVNQYKTEVEQKEILLQKKADELNALNEKILSLNKEIKKTSQKIIQSKEHLNSNKSLFNLAGRNKIKEIQDELNKINEYF